MSEQQQPKEYIITETMLKQWRAGCICPSSPIQFDDQRCYTCQYAGEGARLHCCDFDDNAMETIFRSRPHPAPCNYPDMISCPNAILCSECNVNDIASAAAHQAREDVLRPLKEIQKKFNHLDQCLSDPEWCDGGEGSAIYGISGEMWRAIKESLRTAQSEQAGDQHE